MGRIVRLISRYETLQGNTHRLLLTISQVASYEKKNRQLQ